MKRNTKTTRQNALKARALRFESLEPREMLDVEPIAFLDAASVSDSNSAFFSNAVTDAYPIINLVDSTTGVPFSDGDALQLDSYYIDSSGYALAPSYGETVYKRVAVQNTGTETLTITSAPLSEGSRVEFVGGYKTSLEPNDETILTPKWQALQAESSTLTILSDDPEQPTFELELSGSIRANTTILPSLGSVSLPCDTGASATDSITCNPTVTGAWTNYSFTFQKPTPDVPTISALSLAEPLDSLGQVSADTVITKQIIGAGNRSGVTINFYSGTTLLGSVSKTNIEVRFCPIIFELLRKCRRIIRYPLDDCLHYSSINGNWRDYEVAV